MDTYYDSAEGETIGRARIERELRDHGARPGDTQWNEALTDLGHPGGLPDGVQLDAQYVLRVLGY
jgi:hypothetical protein